MADDDDILKEAREAFRTAADAESHNRETYLEDTKFARASDQWPEDIAKKRAIEGRPMLTINKLEPTIRQVVNDARQNKPSIKVLPADSKADPDTAEVMDGLIRNIEYTSNADVAYDTAAECAVAGGFGYLRIRMDYADEDVFDMDLMIEAVPNPLCVYGDPASKKADSSDWNCAFVVDRLTEDQYEAQWKGKAKVDWDDPDSWSAVDKEWRDDKTVMIAEYWKREEYDKPIYLYNDLRDQSTLVLDDEGLQDEDIAFAIQVGVVVPAEKNGKPVVRTAKCHKVTQYILSGAEVLETNEWPGKYIPIVPVYGIDFNIEGKRYLRSLIHNAKDAQTMFNVWRTTSTELVALAPRTPYIGAKGVFDHDIEKWNRINTDSLPFAEYDSKNGSLPPPMRQPLDGGAAAGALQEAMNASEDIKAVTGIYDASLGARSNETSGKAIMARQREGDVSTFNFQDNMSRGIRHAGRILIDLIPHVYNGERIIRVMGEDGTAENKQLGKPSPVMDPKTGQPMQDEQTGEPITRLHDLTLGKYDLTVKSGPSFTTRREEAAYQMVEMIRAAPEFASIIVPKLAKNLDWPGADEIAEEMEEKASGPSPEIQQAMQEAEQKYAELEKENQQLKMDQTVEMQKAEAQAMLQKQKQDADIQLQREKAEAEIQLEREKAALELELERAKASAQISLQKEQNENDYQLTVDSNERSHELEMTKQDAVDQTGPDGKVKKKPLNAAVMTEVQQLRDILAQNQQEMQKQIDQLARIASAPVELIRDPKTGKASGSRKVFN